MTGQSEQIREAGQRRLAAGLTQFPRAGVGDLEEVLSLRKKLASLESWLGKNLFNLLERELGLRKGVYARAVASGKMRQSVADYHMQRLRAVLETLKALAQSDDTPNPPT